jgi:hypothetical protein
MCMLAQRHGLCGRGRMIDVVAAMRLAGLIERVPTSERRIAKLRPSDLLIALMREHLLGHVRAVRRLLRDSCWPATEIDDHAVIRVIRHLMQRYASGMRLFDVAPELTDLADRDMGMLVFFDLALSWHEVGPDQPAGVTIALLARRNGVSRAHIRKIITDLTAQGLVAHRAKRDTGIEPTPSLYTATERIITTILLAVLESAHHAREAEEI